MREPAPGFRSASLGSVERIFGFFENQADMRSVLLAASGRAGQPFDLFARLRNLFRQHVWPARGAEHVVFDANAAEAAAAVHLEKRFGLVEVDLRLELLAQLARVKNRGDEVDAGL